MVFFPEDFTQLLEICVEEKLPGTRTKKSVLGPVTWLCLNHTNGKDNRILRLRPTVTLVNHVMCYERQGNYVVCNELPFSTVGWVIVRGAVSFGVLEFESGRFSFFFQSFFP